MKVKRLTRTVRSRIPRGYYAFTTTGASKPIAEGRTIKAVLDRATEKGCSRPFIMEKLPKGVIAFF